MERKGKKRKGGRGKERGEKKRGSEGEMDGWVDRRVAGGRMTGGWMEEWLKGLRQERIRIQETIIFS